MIWPDDSFARGTQKCLQRVGSVGPECSLIRDGRAWCHGTEGFQGQQRLSASRAGAITFHLLVNVISVQNCSTASHADAALDHLPRKLGLQVLSDRLEIDIKELRARALADTVRREVLMNLCFEPERGKRGNAEHQLKRVRHVARELLEPDHRIAPTRSAQLGLPRTQIPMAFYSC